MGRFPLCFVSVPGMGATRAWRNRHGTSTVLFESVLQPLGEPLMSCDGQPRMWLLIVARLECIFAERSFEFAQRNTVGKRAGKKFRVVDTDIPRKVSLGRTATDLLLCRVVGLLVVLPSECTTEYPYVAALDVTAYEHDRIVLDLSWTASGRVSESPSGNRTG